MTNLDRLKGTPYLVDGFESFLKNWLELSEPSDKPFPWEAEELARFHLLPTEVQQFYDIVRRWPQAEMLSKTSWDRLAYPPGKPSQYIHSLGEWVTEKQPSSMVLARNHRASWRVEVGVRDENFAVLFTDAGRGGRDLPDGESLQMAVGPAEFLVTFGMRELLLANPLSEWDPQALKQATVIYTGRYHADRELEFLYHPDNGGWLWMREQGRVIMCTYKLERKTR